MLSNLYSQYKSNTGTYYKEPTNATNIVDAQGNFLGYRNTSTGEVVSSTGLTGTSVSQVNLPVNYNDTSYWYKAKNGKHYSEPKGVVNIVNMTGEFQGYQNQKGELVFPTDSYTQKAWRNAQYTSNSAADIGYQVSPTVTIKSNKDSFVEYNGGILAVPNGAISQFNSEHVFTGYKKRGETVTAADIIAMHQTQSYTDATNIGVTEGMQAAKTSMTETYYHYNNMYYKLPENAMIMKNAQGEFTGYTTASGQQIVIANMVGLNQDQFKALHIGKYEGLQAAMTSIHDSTQMNNVGVAAGSIGVSAGTIGVSAGSIGVSAGSIGESAGSIGVSAGSIGVQAGQTGVQEGINAAKTSMDQTYYHYNNMYYEIPTNAIIMHNTQNEFTGYQTAAGQSVMISSMTGLNQDQFAALHIGKFEGEQAAKISTKMNSVGINAGQVGVSAGGIGQLSGNIGVQEGMQAAKTSMDATYLKFGTSYYTIPYGATAQYSATGQFTGYSEVTGSGFAITSLDHMSALTQSQYNATQIGKIEGAHAAMYSGAQNNTGVQEGMQAAKTSMNATYVHYEGHIYQIPAGSIEQYNAQNEFTGYMLSSGESITTEMMTSMHQSGNSYTDVTNEGQVEGAQAAQTSISDTYYKAANNLYYQIPAGAQVMINTSDEQYYTNTSGEQVMLSTLTGLQQSQYKALHIGQYEGAKAASISTSQNNTGVVAGQRAAVTSMVDTHVIQGNNIYTIPAGAAAEYNSDNVLTGYFSNSYMTGGVAEYNYINGVSTLTGYHVPISMMTETVVTSGSTTTSTSSSSSSSANCNPVAPVANGIAQYNHHGCITGYVLKNANQNNYMMLI